MPLKDRDAILAELLEIEAVLQSRKHDHDVQLYPFDMLAGDGDDYRKLAAGAAQDQPRAAALPARGTHLHRTIRARRDRAGSIPPRLPHGPGRFGVRARRAHLWRRALEALGQEPRPQQAGRGGGPCR